ncbi:MAG: hypothetical protein K6F68_06660 [Clostridiales bacterium]|nr:hypothetical protein [Clostridiales bacterium]
MISDLKFILKIVLFLLPFLLFVFFNSLSNMKKRIRSRQLFMPPAALLYSVILFIFMNKISDFCLDLLKRATGLLEKLNLQAAADFLRNFYTSSIVLVMLILFNTAAIVAYVIIKRILTAALSKIPIKEDSVKGKIVSVFYTYDEQDDCWYIKPHLGQARTFLKTAYYGGLPVIIIAFVVSSLLMKKGLITAPFYPVFAVIVIGEIAFFADGLRKDEETKDISVSEDSASRKVLYPLLRKPLRNLFGDKLSSEGTSFSDDGISGASIDDILGDIVSEGGHLGRNYASFIRTKMEHGLKPNADYVRSGYDLSSGKSLLFNTPFYDKLTPYVFYAMSRELMSGGKVLIVLGRHGTQEDLKEWCRRGMLEVSNVPNLWRISELDGKEYEEDEMPDIGIVSRSSVHDLEVHRNNLGFLNKVGFAFIVEPSRLVTTAQIGLNLLIKCCGNERKITFCSVDQNCDGLVDSLSHILMTNITEVSATEYPHGMSSYMCWTADGDYLQHRIVPGVSRYLGIGTELSIAALKNQVKQAVWYGGESFPVLDIHWIAKQYYYDLLDYADLPTTQETFDKYFQTSFNMCNERMSDYSFIVVEDERSNVFETKRNFATIADKQGFVNVISSEYMLREYMTGNTQLFNADAKAIPFITADYARTKRNVVLTLCLKLCIDGVKEQDLKKELLMLGISSDDPGTDLWNEICRLFGADEDCERDLCGNPIISVPADNKAGRISFEKSSTMLFSRKYSVQSGVFESIYLIENKSFAGIILDDLQNAGYIAEQGDDNCYIGTELKGHIYQKYLPGQFFTLNGKYYEMVSVTADNKILVRRASEHINGRLSYRQVRKYSINRLTDSRSMGSLKTVNGIDIYSQFADFTVSTPAYWRMMAYNDFKNGDLVELNGVPERRYFNKQVIKLDFSKLGDKFSDEIRMTLAAVMNEVFVTLFADNQPFICAVTPGKHDIPITYSVEFGSDLAVSDKCIFIIEDSQLDIGLLVAVERNIKRILQIVSDYLDWNGEMTEDSKREEELVSQEIKSVDEAFEKIAADAVADEKPKKKCIFARFFAWIKSLFGKKKKKEAEKAPADSDGQSDKQESGTEEPATDTPDPNAVPEESAPSGAEAETKAEEAEPKKKRGLFGAIKSLFKKKNRDKGEEAQPAPDPEPTDTENGSGTESTPAGETEADEESAPADETPAEEAAAQSTTTDENEESEDE